MRVYLVDGTYELFRQFYGAVRHRSEESLRTAGVTGVLSSVIGLLEQGATHIGVATDHIIESFRNDLWPGYKTGAGIDPRLKAQFEPLELALSALGIVVWPMVELEADDALASAAAVCAEDPAVEQVVICTPDKDLGQCVRGNQVVQLDRMRNKLIDEAAVVAKFGVQPTQIPDYLALVGDSADGFPGIPGYGAKGAAALLRRFGSIEEIPVDATGWDGTGIRGAKGLAGSFASQRDLALLFKRLATLVVEPALLPEGAESLRWDGPTADFAPLADALGEVHLSVRAHRLAKERRAAAAE